jgi:hypothetical protein
MFRKKANVYRVGNPNVTRLNFLAGIQDEILAVALSISRIAPNVDSTQRTNAINKLGEIEQKIINFFVEFEL